MRLGLVQLCASDVPSANLSETLDLVGQAIDGGADLVLTPEVTNCVSADRAHQLKHLRTEEEDPTLAALRDLAARHGVHVLVGSLAVKTDGPRFANRSFLIDGSGSIVARYDKIHMFDVDVTPTETYRESDGYQPGSTAVVAATPWARIGMTICYDLRFPNLYRALAQSGAEVLTVPSAFSPVTGAAHWEPLLRARAIETGCYIVAPAQAGQHVASVGRSRRTYGHSMVVSPWGEVITDMGTATGARVIDIDMAAVRDARRRVPSLSHDRQFSF